MSSRFRVDVQGIGILESWKDDFYDPLICFLFLYLNIDGFVKSRKTPSPSKGEGRGEGE